PKTMGPAGPRSDESRFLSGHPEGSALAAPPRLDGGPWVAVSSWDTTAWAGPWGTSYSANLTPAENTGVGSRSEAAFVAATRTGGSWGAPPCSVPPLRRGASRYFAAEDRRSIYASLRTVPPVRDRVPDPLPPPREAGLTRPRA